MERSYKVEGKDIVASLDVKLLKGNINGITKFKLFLPETRNGSSEVVTAVLINHMGYLSPRTKLVNVNLNSTNQLMIFQEKAAKELLEFNNLRESTIIESDESLLWEIITLEADQNKKLIPEGKGSNIFPKVLNSYWLKKGQINRDISLKGLNIYSNAILESWNRLIDSKDIDYISFSDKILSNGNEASRKILSKFRLHLIAMSASHGLINNNRKFYYDPINNSLIPIYYDGDSEIRNLTKLKANDLNIINKTLLLRDITAEDISSAINEINGIDPFKLKKDLNLLGVKLNLQEIFVIKKYNRKFKYLKIESNQRNIFKI